MIFNSRNEDGVLKADWIASLPAGALFVTRRSKPHAVGAIRSVQAGRGKKGIAKVEVLECVKHYKCFGDYNEAALEGFKTWDGVLNYFKSKKLDINKTYRILMRKL